MNMENNKKKASFISIAGWKRMQPLSFLLYDDFTNHLSSTYKCNFFFFGRTIKAKIANFIHSE